ncbi:MAG: LamB/YcsF family protein [Chloroflexota bacterium]
MRIDLNCDMGESFGHYRIGADDEMMRHITSANIACGFHAGDPLVMARTVAAAVAHGVGIGAHPGYLDLRGFGRRKIEQSPDEIESDIIYQIGALEAFARAYGGTKVTHVKVHGALYNAAEVDPRVAQAVARAVRRYNSELVLVCSATSRVSIGAGEAEGLRVGREAFADRQYNTDGTLRSRRMPNALVTDAALAAERAVRMARDGVIVAYDGTEVPVRADTLCIHGDEPTAPAVAQAVRAALVAAGIEVRGLSDRR